MTTRITKTSFASGQLSERLVGRQDLAQFLTGCALMENFVAFPHGGTTFRSGTYYVNEVKDSSDYVRLVPFVFSNTQSYVLEFGPLYARVYYDHAPLLSGMTHVEVTTPWDAGEFDELDYAQSGDILFCAQGDFAPRQIQRTGASSWSIATFDNRDGPYYDLNTTATTFTLSGTTGSVTLTASAITGINDGAGFQTTDVGRHVRILHGSTWGWGKITARASTTSVTVSVQRAFGATTATANWRLGAWSDTDGWPEAVVLHQQRLFFGRGEYVWGSVTGDFTNFAPTDASGTVTDSNATTYRLVQGNTVRWFQSARTLEVGLEGAESVLSGAAGVNAPLTPSTPRAGVESKEGSAGYAKPVTTNNGTVFLNRTGRKLINFYYSFQKDGYEAEDITLLSEDITYPSLLEIAYQAEPDRIVWAITTDGALIGVTFNPRQEVVSWHQHTIGGSFGSGSAEVESICVIPAPDGSVDELWMAVLRTIDGATVRYIEYLTPLFTVATDIEDAFFVDCGLTYDGTAVTTISGLDHLEGEELAVLADGNVVEGMVVASGEIELPFAASKVHAGLPYTGTLRLLPLDPQQAVDTLTTRRHRVVNVGMLFFQTVLAKVGVGSRQKELVGKREPSDPLGSPVQPKTAYFEVPVESDSDFRNQIEVQQDLPLPCTVLSVTAEVDFA